MNFFILSQVLSLKYKSFLYFFLCSIPLIGIVILYVNLTDFKMNENSKRLLLGFYISLYCIFTFEGFSELLLITPNTEYKTQFAFSNINRSNNYLICIVSMGVLIGVVLDFQIAEANLDKLELTLTSWLALIVSFILLAVVCLEFYVIAEIILVKMPYLNFI